MSNYLHYRKFKVNLYLTKLATSFSVGGFIQKGSKYFKFNKKILAETPAEASEQITKHYKGLSVSSVTRAGNKAEY